MSADAARPARPGQPARIGVVIPALDEERALPLVLSELPRARLACVVVVDNGSRDRTAQCAEEAGALVVREPERGYGAACAAGVAALLGRHAERNAPEPLGPGDVIVFLDGDHSDYPEELERIAEPVLAGSADLCIGSRVLGGATMSAMLPQAWLGNRLACFLMRWLFGLRATDLGPFRAIRVDALEHLAMRDRDFGWTVEMQLKAHVAGLCTLEVPVRYRARIGASKITGTVAGTLGAARKILGWILGWRFELMFTRRSSPKYPSHSRSALR